MSARKPEMKQRWRLVLIIASVHLVAQVAAMAVTLQLNREVLELRQRRTAVTRTADAILDAVESLLVPLRRYLITTPVGAVAESVWVAYLAMVGNALIWAGCLSLLLEGWLRRRRAARAKGGAAEQGDPAL